MKANKDKMTYANAGIGAASHLCGMLFMSAVGVDVLTVPYKGHGPAMNDLSGRPGGLHVRPDHQHHRPDQERQGEGLCGHLDQACPSLPDVPTLDEQGLKGADVGHLARALRAQGDAQAGDRQARRRPAGVHEGSHAAAALHRARARSLPGRQADAGRARGAPQGGDRQVGPIIKKAGVYAD
jgi:hypothetical protein